MFESLTCLGDEKNVLGDVIGFLLYSLVDPRARGTIIFHFHVVFCEKGWPNNRLTPHPFGIGASLSGM